MTDATQPPPFAIGGPIGQKPNNEQNGIGLDSEYAKAAEYATAERLRREQQFAAARQEIEELRVQLASAKAALEAMHDHNDFLENRLNIATVDRTMAIKDRAIYAALIEVIEAGIAKIKQKPLENGG